MLFKVVRLINLHNFSLGPIETTSTRISDWSAYVSAVVVPKKTIDMRQPHVALPHVVHLGTARPWGYLVQMVFICMRRHPRDFDFSKIKRRYFRNRQCFKTRQNTHPAFSLNEPLSLPLIHSYDLCCSTYR